MPFFTREPFANGYSASAEQGSRLITSKGKTVEHLGMDLIPSGSTDVIAAHDGAVAFVGEDPVFGKYVVVEASDARKTFYANLNSTSVSVGQTISASGTTKIGIAKDNDIMHFGVIETDGRVSNPRTYLTEAFPNSFDKYVRASVDTTGDIIGDSRKNVMIDSIEKSSPSKTFKGLGGKDFYYFDFSSESVIDDSDFDARLICGDGENGVMIEGNALPRKKPDGTLIDGEWTLKEYLLTKAENGQDLRISIPGVENGVTVKGFFTAPENGLVKFGINTGQVVNDKTALNSAVTVADNEASFPVVYASSKANGRFFAPTQVQSVDGGTFDYIIKTYDAQGFPVKEQKLTNNINAFNVDGSGSVQGLVTSGQSATLSDGTTGFIYVVDQYDYRSGGILQSATSSAYLAITDAEGNVVSNEQISQTVSSSFAEYNTNRLNPSLVSTKDGKDYVCFIKGGTTSVCGEISGGKLLGELTANSNSFPTVDNSRATLATGHKIKANGNSFSISAPILSTPTADEVRVNYTPEEGIHYVSPLEQETIITLQNSNSLVFTPTANSRSVISGLETSNSIVDLAAYGLTEEELNARTFTVSESDYSMEQLLAGEFAPTIEEGTRKLSTQHLRRRKLDDVSNSTSFFDFVDDDAFAQTEINTITPAISDTSKNFTVVALPNNQLLIFTDIAASNVQGLTSLVGAPSFVPTPRPTTASPTYDPSQSPSGIPSGIPTGMPTGFPTSLPSGFPSGFPTSTPTGGPSKRPTRQPSAKPSAQPSNDPSNSPTGEPSNDPSNSPTGQPSSVPTKLTPLPSSRPTGRPSLRTFSPSTHNPSTHNPSTHNPSTYSPSSALPTGGSKYPTNQPFESRYPTIATNTYPPSFFTSLMPTIQEGENETETVEPSAQLTFKPTPVNTNGTKQPISPTNPPINSPSDDEIGDDEIGNDEIGDDGRTDDKDDDIINTDDIVLTPNPSTAPTTKQITNGRKSSGFGPIETGVTVGGVVLAIIAALNYKKIANTISGFFGFNNRVRDENVNQNATNPGAIVPAGEGEVVLHEAAIVEDHARITATQPVAQHLATNHAPVQNEAAPVQNEGSAEEIDLTLVQASQPAQDPRTITRAGSAGSLVTAGKQNDVNEKRPVTR